jgi:hypothetical protein
MNNFLPGRPALRQGLIFGIILAVIAIAFGFIGGNLGGLGTLISLAIYLIFGLLAGRRASMETGKMSTGVLAGFLAGVVASIIASIISIILTVINIDSIRKSLQQSANQQHLNITYTNGLVIQIVLLSALFGLVLAALLSLAGGALGGYFGKGRAPTPPAEEYKESMFVPPPRTPTQEPQEPEA